MTLEKWTRLFSRLFWVLTPRFEGHRDSRYGQQLRGNYRSLRVAWRKGRGGNTTLATNRKCISGGISFFRLWRKHFLEEFPFADFRGSIYSKDQLKGRSQTESHPSSQKGIQ